MNRKGFVFYRSFYEAIKNLDNKNKCEIIDAICEFGLNQTEIKMSPITTALFTLIKPQLEANHKRYLNGLKPKYKQTESKLVTKEKDKVKDKDKDKVNIISRFEPPSLTDVTNEFFTRLGNNPKAQLEAENFYNFYGSKNWFIGKNKMRNYKLAIAGWITRNKIKQNEKSNTSSNFKDRTFGVTI